MSDRSDPVTDTAHPRLSELWHLHVADDDELLDRLLVRHREKHRRYHDVSHVAWVVGCVDDLAAVEATLDVDAVVAAAFYHDAVYEPTSAANERASARLARRDLASLGWTPGRASHVAAMIEATKDHRAPPDIDHAVLFDADLSILGAHPDHYRAYVDAVRAEYRHVDDEAWAVGRRQVLEGFLDRTTIYATTTGRDRWEAAARANIERERDALRR